MNFLGQGFPKLKQYRQRDATENVILRSICGWQIFQNKLFLA